MTGADNAVVAMKECAIPSRPVASFAGLHPALAIFVAAASVWLGLMSSASAATQAEIDQARDRAAAWLIKNQRGDGMWSNGGSTDISVSAQALLALVSANVKGF